MTAGLGILEAAEETESTIEKEVEAWGDSGGGGERAFPEKEEVEGGVRVLLGR